MTPARRVDRGKAASSTQLWRVDAPLRVGISSCLLGEEVRWDGGHKRDRFLTDVLAPYAEWVPVCPEVELGMGTPREPVRLVRREGEIVMLGTKSGRDWTAPMRAWSEKRARQLSRLDLCGYVLKKDSP
ncbi:MAG: 2-thiouracil desulfurase family protein, partial [Planctomycetota bacterium]